MSQSNPYKTRTGMSRVWWATRYSYEGLFAAFRHESAFRQEALLAAVMVPGAFWLGRSWLETAMLLLTVALVLVVELLNSAIEAVVDRHSFEWHELAKRAKDYGSAAVHLSLLLCAGVWSVALWHRLLG